MSDPWKEIADEWDRKDETKNIYSFDEERFSRSVEEQARKNAAKTNGHATPPADRAVDIAVEQKPKPKFPLIRFSDLKADTFDRAYIVKGIIPNTGLIAVWGPPKCGKSFWVLDLFLHVALDWKYRDHKVKQGSIVYCAFEGAAGFGKRADAFRKHYGIPADHDTTVLPIAVANGFDKRSSGAHRIHIGTIPARRKANRGRARYTQP